MINRKAYYAALRGPGKLFPGLTDTQVSGQEAVLDCWEHNARDFADPRHLAYCLATAYHETARTMQPVAEYGHGHGHTYGLPAGPYGKVYYGRGLVQLTWFDNYVKAHLELRDFHIDIDLVRNPDLALGAVGAPEILLYGMNQGWFTGKKLTDYFNHSASDPVDARRIVNGLDKAESIASYYQSFLSALRAT